MAHGHRQEFQCMRLAACYHAYVPYPRHWGIWVPRCVAGKGHFVNLHFFNAAGAAVDNLPLLDERVLANVCPQPFRHALNSAVEEGVVRQGTVHALAALEVGAAHFLLVDAVALTLHADTTAVPAWLASCLSDHLQSTPALWALRWVLHESDAAESIGTFPVALHAIG
eukprot:6491259-Amphidinium_carterae.3